MKNKYICNSLFQRGSRGILLLAVILFTQYTHAQVANDVVGANSTGMGGFNSTLSDVWSTNNNQAGLGFMTDISGGIFYENRFLLKETSYRAGAFVLPVKTGAFGLSVASFGYSAYSETKAGVSYGQRFGDNFSLGVQINYLNTKLNQDYGSKNSLTGAIGFIAKLNKEITMGVHIYNPTRSKLAEYDTEKIPTIMKLGLDYRFSKKVMVGVETEKDLNYNAIVKAGIEYHITEIFYLRGGISTSPTLSSFGFGLQMKNFKMDVSSSFHQTLGLTPGISLIYQKKKSSKKVDNPSI
ncbi:MAG: hypothetical protein P1U41_04830 [Vicingaceae bacterium]|nr:hypothetical protein [Vicingaceae bacterium]